MKCGGTLDIAGINEVWRRVMTEWQRTGEVEYDGRMNENWA